MRITSRRKTIAFFLTLGVGLAATAVAVGSGWIILNWQEGVKVFLGFIFFCAIAAGIILNTIFLVREIRRNEQHDSFINAVTHELKTPIASIRLYLETLQSRPVDETRRREFYGLMLSDTDRLLGTVEQVLKAGQAAQRGAKHQRVELEFDGLVRDCMELVRTRHHLQSEALRYDNAARNGNPPRVFGDAEELRTAVSNLIDNAVKYSDGDVRVTVETAPVDGKYAVVRVNDHGSGIPKAELKQIFKRFYRGAGPQSTRVKGTGLGLYIVRSVAKRHGGRAWAESEGPGHGSTFVLQLPIAK